MREKRSKCQNRQVRPELESLCFGLCFCGDCVPGNDLCERYKMLEVLEEMRKERAVLEVRDVAQGVAVAGTCQAEIGFRNVKSRSFLEIDLQQSKKSSLIFFPLAGQHLCPLLRYEAVVVLARGEDEIMRVPFVLLPCAVRLTIRLDNGRECELHLPRATGDFLSELKLLISEMAGVQSEQLILFLQHAGDELIPLTTPASVAHLQDGEIVMAKRIEIEPGAKRMKI
jgi:hypothetical protein